MTGALGFIAVVLSFALAFTAHVVLTVALLSRSPRWHGLLGALFPPAAVVFGLRQGVYRRATALLLSLVAYGLAHLLTSRP